MDGITHDKHKKKKK